MSYWLNGYFLYIVMICEGIIYIEVFNIKNSTNTSAKGSLVEKQLSCFWVVFQAFPLSRQISEIWHGIFLLILLIQNLIPCFSCFFQNETTYPTYEKRTYDKTYNRILNWALLLNIINPLLSFIDNSGFILSKIIDLCNLHKIKVVWLEIFV